MFFIDITFNKKTTEFSFNMDLAKVEKNDELFFDEIEKVKSFIIKDGETINYELLYKIFYKFKKDFSKKFLIDETIDETVNFTIYNDSFNDKEKIINFINQNPNLNITLYVKDYTWLINNLKNNDYPNLKINFENSKNSIPYNEFYNMYIKLDEIICFIKHYDLSDLEKVMLVYDIVKANVYHKEDSNESSSKSRDLNEIVNGDKIVCVGYANLINYLLTNLDIKNKCIITKNTETNIGHQRNYLYLDDKKYNIKGAFFLDVTADSKKSNDYIDNYRYFLKPYNFFNNKKDIIINPQELSLLSQTDEELLWDLINKKEDTILKLLKLLNFVDIKYSLIVFLSQIYSDESKFKELIDLVKNEYNSSIDETKFKTALYKVRRVEYLNNIITLDFFR